jgi:hypothetical protein
MQRSSEYDKGSTSFSIVVSISKRLFCKHLGEDVLLCE